jgi:hypothetical protein
MTVWIVSLEWNQPKSEVTGDTGIVGVFVDEDTARVAQQAERAELAEAGEVVYQYSIGDGVYCAACGERELDARGFQHWCECDPDTEAEFCVQCGAELNDRLSCDNDHAEWDVDVHCTEHTVEHEAMRHGVTAPQGVS